ncbi:MAG: hypothetical protein AVDCRST_MAG86-1701 [uncultured Truepera sp.]|uniref:DUF676 domain-containing protein n=1 Tax=uncultured Truepera sp. TaxID=543023 RepID=A0A6J4VDZ4_9DEIN|nr:MAG: hypothetical protein AVDCRST_MAG86-1701 [uncultured Truepera sp.]
MARRLRKWRPWWVRLLIGMAATLVVFVALLTFGVIYALREARSLAGDIFTSLIEEGIPTVINRAATTSVELPVVPYRVHPTRYEGESFPFSEDRPTIIVLLHGATRSPAPNAVTGTLAGSRAYWGYDFVAGLLGSDELETLDGITLDRETWRTAALGDAPAHHLIRAAEEADSRLVMITHRDGSDYLGPQTTAVVEQVHALHRYARARLGKEPQLILLAHSMGGLVSRYLLSNPEVRAPNFSLSKGVRVKADFLRDRTLYLITEATPHLGSLAADNALLIERLTAFQNDILERWNIEVDPQEIDLHHSLIGFLRAGQPSTEHLRTDTLAELNHPDRGLLAPQHARRTDGSLIPIYTLSGRSPAGGFFDNPNVDLGTEVQLLEFVGERTRLGDKLLFDTLSMVLTDYLLYNFPGLTHGWGKVPQGLAELDRVGRFSAFSSQVVLTPPDQPERILKLEAFPVYYLQHRWDAIAPSSDTTRALQDWLAYALQEAIRPITPLLEVASPTTPLDTIRGRYVGTDAAYAGIPGAANPDGYIDSDGVVGLDSGLGLFLGTAAPEYFSHERVWPVGGKSFQGSWYRIFDGRYPQRTDEAFPWDWGNHGLVQYSGEVAAWISEHILADAGPYVGQATLSGWKAAATK